jgi:hypothetical protein
MTTCTKRVATNMQRSIAIGHSTRRGLQFGEKQGDGGGQSREPQTGMNAGGGRAHARLTIRSGITTLPCRTDHEPSVR